MFLGLSFCVAVESFFLYGAFCPAATRQTAPGKAWRQATLFSPLVRLECDFVSCASAHILILADLNSLGYLVNLKSGGSPISFPGSPLGSVADEIFGFGNNVFVRNRFAVSAASVRFSRAFNRPVSNGNIRVNVEIAFRPCLGFLAAHRSHVGASAVKVLFDPRQEFCDVRPQLRSAPCRREPHCL